MSYEFDFNYKGITWVFSLLQPENGQDPHWTDVIIASEEGFFTGGFIAIDEVSTDYCFAMRKAAFDYLYETGELNKYIN